MKRHEIEKDEGLRENLSEARFFKGGRREPPATRVWTDGIIESLNVSEHSAGSLVVGMEMQQMEALAFEAAKEVFGDSVVVGIALTAHALDEPSAHEGGAKACGGVLDAAIGVEDQAGVIRESRKTKKMTQEALAEATGLSQMSVRRYESDDRMPPADIAASIAKALGVDVDYLLNGLSAKAMQVINEAAGKPEAQMNYLMDKLNDAGKGIAVDVVAGLTSIPKFQADPSDLQEE